MPAPSMTCAAGASIVGATATIAPSRTCTSPVARSGTAGSMVSTVTPRMSSSPRPGSGALAVRASCCADRPCGMSAADPNTAAPCISPRRLNFLPVICMPPTFPSSISRHDQSDLRLALYDCGAFFAAVGENIRWSNIWPTMNQASPKPYCHIVTSTSDWRFWLAVARLRRGPC